MTSPKVVFILGSQRGGTTIFGRLLGEVEGFLFAGAVRRLWLPEAGERCSCGQPNHACPLWSEVLDRVQDAVSAQEISAWQVRHLSNRHSWLGALGLAVEARRGRPAPPTLEAYADVVDRLYRAVAELTRARVVVDTSKHPNDAVLLSQRSKLPSYFVQIVRDPRGSAYSVEQRDSAREAKAGALRHSTRMRLVHTWRTAHATLNWIARHGASEVVRRTVPQDRSLLVRYEDLAESPIDVLQRVAEFVGEEPAHFPTFDGGSVSLAESHFPSCAKLLPAASVPFRLDDRWVSGLTTADAVVAAVLAAPLMRRYGYPLRPPRPGSMRVRSPAPGYPSSHR